MRLYLNLLTEISKCCSFNIITNKTFKFNAFLWNMLQSAQNIYILKTTAVESK